MNLLKKSEMNKIPKSVKVIALFGLAPSNFYRMCKELGIK